MLKPMSRVALAVPFLKLGYDAAAEPGLRGRAATAFGIPEQYADAAVRANGTVMVLGGLSLLTGVQPRLGALGIAASMVPTTLAGHPFWKDTDPVARKTNQIQFLKNLGLVGGLLAVAATPRRRR